MTISAISSLPAILNSPESRRGTVAFKVPDWMKVAILARPLLALATNILVPIGVEGLQEDVALVFTFVAAGLGCFYVGGFPGDGPTLEGQELVNGEAINFAVARGMTSMEDMDFWQ